MIDWLMYVDSGWGLRGRQEIGTFGIESSVWQRPTEEFAINITIWGDRCYSLDLSEFVWRSKWTANRSYWPNTKAEEEGKGKGIKEDDWKCSVLSPVVKGESDHIEYRSYKAINLLLDAIKVIECVFDEKKSMICSLFQARKNTDTKLYCKAYVKETWEQRWETLLSSQTLKEHLTRLLVMWQNYSVVGGQGYYKGALH